MSSLLQETGRIYLDFYGLREPPFAITPDPEYLYLSRTHQATLEKILYGIGNRLGFILLTGEVGTGKTTLCRHLLDLLREQAETVYVVNPAFSGKELAASILDDLGIPYPPRATKKALIDLLNRFLLSPELTRPVVLIIDDAQAMPAEAMENLRLLSNLETDKVKLLQILLVGQPELEERIGRPELRQLRQRIALQCRLELLNREETEEYITRRLYASGSNGSLRFTRPAVDLIHRHSGGIPRLINKICDFSLVAGYVTNDAAIAPPHVQRALLETGSLPAADGGKSRNRRRERLMPALIGALLALVAFWGWQQAKPLLAALMSPGAS